MANSTLTRLKLSLPVTSDAYDAILSSLINRAAKALQMANTGIDPDDLTEDDEVLVVMYAAWLWRSNKQPDLPMPPALRLAINDRKIAVSTGGVPTDG
jgi:hypothetical protein